MAKKLNPAVLEKESKVLELRRGGLPFDLIATRVGYASASGAFAAYERACKRIVHEEVEQTRKLEMERLDIAQAAIWNNVIQGEIPSIMAFVRISERRAKLLGLDVPIKAQLEVNIYEREFLDAETQRIRALINSGTLPILDGEVVENGTEGA